MDTTPERDDATGEGGEAGKTKSGKPLHSNPNHHQKGFITGEFLTVIWMAASIVNALFWLVSAPI
jgi:hypothetical protein